MKFKIEPWKHQLEAIMRALQLLWFALFFEMGAGKTMTCINILRAKFNELGEIGRTLIFCPPLVIPNWKDEWKANSNIDMKLVVPLYGAGKKRLALFLSKAYNVDGSARPAIFITNYESLLMPDLYKAFVEWKAQAVVFDESHKLKSPTAKRAKAAYVLANPRHSPKPWTYLLSGSPVLSSPMDLFMQFYIMDGGHTFGSNFFAFRARYFRDRNANMPKDRYFPKWEIMTMEKDGVDSLTSINQKIFACSMRVEKKDCLDLPPEVSVVIKCGMTPTQERLYKELKKDFITFFNSKACTASLAIVKAMRLMQICSGFVATENPDDQENAQVIQDLGPTPKDENFIELLSEILESGNSALVWTVHRHTYPHLEKLCEEVKKKTGIEFEWVQVHGDISAAKKREAVERFKSEKQIRVFIGHPGSGGIGINLTKAAYSIFYSRTFSLEQYLQARARNHRGGAKEEGHNSITHYDLACEGTIEEIALANLANKRDMSDKLLSEIASEIQDQGA